MSNESNFEIGDSEFDNQNYKSCFARSVAVNSDLKLEKITALKKGQSNQGEVLNGAIPKMSDMQGQNFVRMRKVSKKIAELSVGRTET